MLGEGGEKRGAEKEVGHLNIMLTDKVCRIRVSRLASADIAELRNRMKTVGYVPATIVRRLNLIQTIIEHARREWRVQLPLNARSCALRRVAARR